MDTNLREQAILNRVYDQATNSLRININNLAALDARYLKLTGSLADVSNHSHTVLTDIGTLSHATIDSYLDQAVKSTSIPQFAKLGLGMAASHLFDIKALAGVSSGAITMTPTNPGVDGTFTTSAPITLEAGDVVVPDSTPTRHNVVSVGGTGTSFTAGRDFDITFTETFKIYKPIHVEYDSSGNVLACIQGYTGFLGIRTIAPTDSIDITSDLQICASWGLIRNEFRIYSRSRASYISIGCDSDGGSEGVFIIGSSKGKVIQNTDAGWGAYYFNAANSTARINFASHPTTSYDNIGAWFQWNTNTNNTVHPIWEFTPQNSTHGNLNASSGVQVWFGLQPVINQTGTAGYTASLVNVTESAVGSGLKLLADWQVGSTSKASISDTGLLTALGGLNAGSAGQFTVSTVGAIVGVGLNAGTGLIQGTGGANITGQCKLGYLDIGGTGDFNVSKSGYVGYIDNTSGVHFRIYTSVWEDAMILGTSKDLKIIGPFGCNNATPQTAYASGGAVTDTATSGGYGFTDAAHFNSMMTLLGNIRSALVANGIMS